MRRTMPKQGVRFGVFELILGTGPLG